MNQPSVLCQQELHNKYINTKKRPRQPHGKYHQHKKFKSNEIQIENKLDDDIVTLFKLEFKRILANAKVLNTIIEDIQPYGSRISGLFTDDSDVDFHISYNAKTPIKTVMKLFAKNLRYSQMFMNIISLNHAKIPIIKCVHRNTGINCDISFNNISAVYNSHLLNRIINMDHRIKSVLMELKTWAKSIGLISTNGFSSYSFYWLGLFSMQVMGILPAIHDLQKSIPELLIGHWNCAFPKEKQEFTNSQKSLSASDILNIIYAYYSDFDFNSYVISPYSGCPLLKKDFEIEEQLPEELWRYKQFHKENKEHPKLLFLGICNYSMYIQDPFQHNLNITARVTPKIFKKFIDACKEKKNLSLNV